MSKTILIDFDTELFRTFEDQRPIGVLLERGNGDPGFDTQYLFTVTDDEDETGHDNYMQTAQAVEEFRSAWDQGAPVEIRVADLFTYLADQSYLGLRLRTLSKVDDSVTLEEAFNLYVVGETPLPVLDDEEFPTDV